MNERVNVSGGWHQDQHPMIQKSAPVSLHELNRLLPMTHIHLEMTIKLV